MTQPISVHGIPRVRGRRKQRRSTHRVHEGSKHHGRRRHHKPSNADIIQEQEAALWAR